MPATPGTLVQDPARLAALRRLALLDTPAEEAFDKLAQLATALLAVPVALVTVVDKDRQFFKSCIGLPEPWASRRETPLSHSFCQHVVTTGEPLVVSDARRDPLLCDNLAIRDLGVIAYAGVPLTTRDGYTIGTLCAIDHEPREWKQTDLELLQYLAGAALGRIERADERLLLVSRATHDVVWDWDLLGNTVWWNENIEAQFGHARAALEVGPESRYTRIHPDDADRVIRSIHGTLDAGGIEWFSEYRFRRVDGSYADVFDRGYVIRDDQGRAVRMVGAMADITERNRALAALREREEHFRSLIEHSAETIAIFAPDGTVEYVSPPVERNRGYETAALVGRNGFELLHPDDLAPVHEAFRAAFREPGCLLSVEYRIRHRDGSWRLTSAVGHVVQRAEGPRLILNARDITQQRRTEEQLRQAQKLEAVGQLTAGIAHDFNNILAVIMANAELVALSLGDDAAGRRRDLSDVAAAAHSGAALIRQLMAFSREAPLQVAAHDLTAILRDAVVMLRRLLPKQIAVILRESADASIALVDPGAVQQILMNLATNARDAMPDGGTLEIGVAAREVGPGESAKFPWLRAGRYRRIAVRDTGVGMDEATKQRVFEPFFTTKPAGKGTGLGMAMIYGLTKQHGGFVELDSAPGRGTEVAVYFPAAAAPGVPTPPAPQAAPVRGRGETVLLVDDEESMRRTGQRVLARFGYQPLVAADAGEALALLDQHGSEIALLICDVELPAMSGLELYEAIHQRGGAVKTLFATGHAIPRIEEQLGPNADVSVIQKPWTIGEFTRAVRAALDRQ